MSEEEKKYWVAFDQSFKIGFSVISLLLKYFGDLKTAWEKGNYSEFKKTGLKENIISEIINLQKKIDPEAVYQRILSLKINILIYKDKNYPKILKEIYSPPAILYIRGEIKKEDDFALGVVGTRKFSSYGKQATRDIVYGLSKAGITIISGLAVGIDTEAHKTALEAGGRTIAVLGGGIDDSSIFPSINKKLAEQIINQGAIISEYPPGTSSLKQNFPARNRIIAGLSLGTLVVEANEKSGALITARDALEQGKDVFAVPGNIYSEGSKGPHNLIKMGAKLVTSYEDILGELNLESAKRIIEARKIIPETPEEAEILKYLSREPVHIDFLIKKTKMDTHTVNSTLSLMEIKGKVRHLGGMNYILGY